MKKNLRLILKGGLGNQLLQYFAGLQLSRVSTRELIVDTSWYSRNIHSNKLLDKRNFLLNQYQFSKDLNIENEMNWKNSPRTERVLKELPSWVGKYIGFYEDLKLDEVLHLNQREVTVFGHWVTNPIIPNREILRQQLVKGILDPSSNFKILQKEISEKKIISIHHRLGDYKNFTEAYGVMNEDYFARAVQHVSRDLNFEKGEVWLFSDEPELSRRLLSQSIEIAKVISRDFKISEAETISLMSQSAGIVCSNSTFSWWAGLLSDESITTVAFPRYYMKGLPTIETGLYVKDWNYL